MVNMSALYYIPPLAEESTRVSQSLLLCQIRERDMARVLEGKIAAVTGGVTGQLKIVLTFCRDGTDAHFKVSAGQ